ncbi:MAG TPA: hypothetical protein VE544_00665 [Nitrososphaeraceae archaeon]|nr:hypothetical protein [Nitrososphaeraceae archaeon]
MTNRNKIAAIPITIIKAEDINNVSHRNVVVLNKIVIVVAVLLSEMKTLSMSDRIVGGSSMLSK